MPLCPNKVRNGKIRWFKIKPSELGVKNCSGLKEDKSRRLFPEISLQIVEHLSICKRVLKLFPVKSATPLSGGMSASYLINPASHTVGKLSAQAFNSYDGSGTGLGVPWTYGLTHYFPLYLETKELTLTEVSCCML